MVYFAVAVKAYSGNSSTVVVSLPAGYHTCVVERAELVMNGALCSHFHAFLVSKQSFIRLRQCLPLAALVWGVMRGVIRHRGHPRAVSRRGDGPGEAWEPREP